MGERGVLLEGTTKYFGNSKAVDGIDLEIRSGEFLSLLGASGCGKTTTLRLIAGFILPSSGRIYLGERDVTFLRPHRRNTGMVFQQYALFPHLTVTENVAFGLRVRGIPRDEISRRVEQTLELVRLPGFGDRYPSQLSGGQQQRIALARAIVIEPEVLLLDEPLGALDVKLRQAMQLEIKRIHETLGMTMIYVTHDQEEALAMSDRVAVMRDGRILQVGTPQELYEQSRSRFVAEFIGTVSLLRVVPESNEEEGGLLTVRWRAHDHRVFRGKNALLIQTLAGLPSRPILLAVRPEKLRIGEPQLENAVTGIVRKMVYHGKESICFAELDSGESLIVGIPSGNPVPCQGERVAISWGADDCTVLADDAP